MGAEVGLTTLGQPFSTVERGAQPYPWRLGQHAVLTLPVERDSCKMTRHPEVGSALRADLAKGCPPAS